MQVKRTVFLKVHFNFSNLCGIMEMKLTSRMEANVQKYKSSEVEVEAFLQCSVWRSVAVELSERECRV